MTQLIKYSLAVFVISLSLSANAATTRNLSTNKQATATTSQFKTQMNETRAAMEKMQEEDFQHFIKALKNNPPADQLPADAQERRSMMIKRLQAQHAFIIKTRKQHQRAFKSHFRKQVKEARMAMEKRQEEDFQHFIKALKNNPPADQLPAEAQERRLMMIKRLQTQHAFMVKTRKQHQQAFRNHFHKQLKDARIAMEKRQEQDFQRYIKALKNNPPADQLPADAQERRSMMIKRLQAQHAFMIKARKQYQPEARKDIRKK